ncbi:MAG: GNAT family N-acetyltransferase [Hyphomicrobiaceae bacterium]|nr:GNAT family N-acetyltransferase [Hyphomicrobiaceae bacterium]
MTDRWKPGSAVRLETPRFQLASLSRLQAAWHSYAWTSDPLVMHPYGLEAGSWTRRSWHRRLRRFNNRRRFCIGIRPKGGAGLIGYETAEVSSQGVAFIAVMIGDRDWWGKGVVQETRSAVIDFLFENVGCARVWGTPGIRNFPSIFNYQKLGFTCEGTLRQHGWDPATRRRQDYFIFGLLRDEWLEKRKQQAAI